MRSQDNSAILSPRPNLEPSARPIAGRPFQVQSKELERNSLTDAPTRQCYPYPEDNFSAECQTCCIAGRPFHVQSKELERNSLTEESMVSMSHKRLRHDAPKIKMAT